MSCLPLLLGFLVILGSSTDPSGVDAPELFFSTALMAGLPVLEPVWLPPSASDVSALFDSKSWKILARASS